MYNSKSILAFDSRSLCFYPISGLLPARQGLCAEGSLCFRSSYRMGTAGSASCATLLAARAFFSTVLRGKVATSGGKIYICARPILSLLSDLIPHLSCLLKFGLLYFSDCKWGGNVLNFTNRASDVQVDGAWWWRAGLISLGC